MILGLNFPQYPVVTVGGAPAFVVGRGGMSLTVVTPAGVPGSRADVTVADRAGRAVTMAGAYRYDSGSTGTGTPPSGGGTPTTGTPPSGGYPPPSGGSGPTPAPGTPTEPATPPGGGGTPTPAPTATVPPGPSGSTYRPDPTVGTAIVWNGLRLAPVLANSPVGSVAPSQWASWRCTQVTCSGVAV